MRIAVFISIVLLSMVKTNGQIKDTNITSSVEIMPEYPGGQTEMNNFLDKNLTYPDMAKKQGIEGKVWVGFTVDRDGMVKDVVVLRGIGGGCDEEAKRVVELMPNWIPGTIDGQPVEVKFRFPINFILKDTNDNKKKKKNH